MTTLDQAFWNDRWKNKETGWDIGHASPALTKYADALLDKDIAILIPGCGNAHEARHLLQSGFTNITLIDIAPALVVSLQKELDQLEINIICGDFFEHAATYDLILEQTFFCAIDPSLRPQYAQKMHQLLKPNGKIAGVLFSKIFDKQGPPFGGSKEEYIHYFNPYFHINKLESCYNSIAPRAGTELFMELEKK